MCSSRHDCTFLLLLLSFYISNIISYIITCLNCYIIYDNGTGASAASYLLTGYDPSQIVPGSGTHLNLTQLNAAKTSAGAMQATFRINLAQNASSTSQIPVM